MARVRFRATNALTADPIGAEAEDRGSAAEPVASRPASRSRLRLERFAAGVVLVGVFVGLYASYPRVWNKVPVFTSPRQSAGYELSRQWARTGKPVERLPLYESVPNDIALAFTPRDAASRNGEVVPKDFPLVVATFAVAHKVGANVVLLVLPLAGVVALSVLALLAWELTRSRVAVWLAVILLASTTAFWMNSSWIYAPAPLALSAVLLGVYAFVRATRSPSRAWNVLGGVACAVATGLRYDNAAVVGVIWLAFLVADRRAWRRWLIVPAVAALCCLPFLAFNAWLYGSPRTTGYSLAYTLIDRTVHVQGRGLLAANTALLFDQVRLYLFRPEVLVLVVVGVAGMITLVRRERDRAVTALALATIAVTVAIFCYAGTRNVTGATAFTAGSSLLRYLLPGFALLAIFGAAAVARRSTAVQVGAFVVAVVIAGVAMHTNVDAIGGVRENRAAVARSRADADAIIHSTPADAIIITRLYSKVLWPRRQVLSTAFLIHNETAIHLSDDASVYYLHPPTARLVDVIARLVHEGRRVYLYNDGGWMNGVEYTDLVRELAARRVRETGPNAYRVLIPFGAA